MGKNKRQFWESARMNTGTYVQHYNRLTEMAISRFKWNGLPDTVDARFLELCLFGTGSAVFFRDEELGFLCLRCTLNGRWDVYNVPIDRTAIANNGYTRKLSIDNSVIIWNNALRTPSKLDIEIFAKRLYNLDRIIDVNSNAQKTPVLIQCDENERLSMVNLYKQWDGNEPFIFGNRALNPKSVSVLKTDAPYVADKLFDLKTAIWNEAMTYLGVDNVSLVKKERLITEEAVRDSGGTVACRLSVLNARQQACEQINAMFGLNISCEFRQGGEVSERVYDSGEMDM